MKLTNNSQRDRYTIEVGPEESFDIVFDPAGVNAAVGSNGAKQALSIRGMTLPDGALALAIRMHDNWLFKDVPLNTYPSSLVIWRHPGVDQAEFIMNKECPRIDLKLKKINLSELLKEPDE